MGFDQLNNTLKIMENFKYPWYFAGGWALDLGAKKVTREHNDVDIVIFKEYLPRIFEYFYEWDRKIAVPGENRLVPCNSMADVFNPRHELHFEKNGSEIEILLTECINGEVYFRRDKSISMDLGQFACVDSQGRNYISPAMVFLYKAKNTANKDEEDFNNHVDKMPTQDQKWLLERLRQHKPDSLWISKLETLVNNP